MTASTYVSCIVGRGFDTLHLHQVKTIIMGVTGFDTMIRI